MKKKAPISIKQLAKLANLSTATISRVLNDNGRFSEKTREIVLSLVKKTGYTPNVAAKALRTKTARAIGLIIPDLSNEFFLKIVNSVERFFFANDYSLFVCSAGEDERKNHSLVKNLLGKGVDGLIYISRFPLKAGEVSIPTVYLDRVSDHEEGLVMVSSDNIQGGKLAAETLMQAGSCHPVMVCDRDDFTSLSTVHDRITGFSEALVARGISWSDKNIVFAPATIAQARKSFLGALKSGLRCDGVLASSDIVAIGTILAIEDFGLRVPKDINVIGFDDISFSEYFKPSLTTIRQDTGKLGTAGAKALLSIMEKKSIGTQHIKIPVQLIVRDSTRRSGEVGVSP